MKAQKEKKKLKRALPKCGDGLGGPCGHPPLNPCSDVLEHLMSIYHVTIRWHLIFTSFDILQHFPHKHHLNDNFDQSH